MGAQTHPLEISLRGEKINVNPPNHDWNLLGQLKLSPDSSPDETIENWLLKVLEPIRLPPDLFDKLRASVKETISRLHKTSDFSDTLLKIYVSRAIKTSHPSNNYWGFFGLEKVGLASGEETFAKHVIEYYLYLEK